MKKQSKKNVFMPEKAEKVVPSERSKVFKTLKTPEDFQKSIQSMHSEAKADVARMKSDLKPMAESQVRSLLHYVNETKKIEGLTNVHLHKFWNEAYSHNELVQQYLNEK